MLEESFETDLCQTDCLQTAESLLNENETNTDCDDLQSSLTLELFETHISSLDMKERE